MSTVGAPVTPDDGLLAGVAPTPPFPESAASDGSGALVARFNSGSGGSTSDSSSACLEPAVVPRCLFGRCEWDERENGGASAQLLVCESTLKWIAGHSSVPQASPWRGVPRGGPGVAHGRRTGSFPPRLFLLHHALLPLLLVLPAILGHPFLQHQHLGRSGPPAYRPCFPSSSLPPPSPSPSTAVFPPPLTRAEAPHSDLSVACAKVASLQRWARRSSAGPNGPNNRPFHLVLGSLERPFQRVRAP